MFLLLPMAIGAGIVYYLFVYRSQTQVFHASCGVLTPAERAVIDTTLAMPNGELLSSGRSRGLDKAAVVGDLYAASELSRTRGCEPEARALAAKAQSVAREAEAPALLPPSPFPQLAAPAGSVVAPEVQLGAGVGYESAWSPVVPMDGMPASSPAPPSGPVIARARTTTAAWIRPEPRPWDDAWGRFGFRVPAGFPVGVMHFAPAGWAHVAVDHPDEGRVEGFIEATALTPEQATPGMQPGMRPGMQGAPGAPGNAGPVFMKGTPTPGQRTRDRAAALKKKRRRAAAAAASRAS